MTCGCGSVVQPSIVPQAVPARRSADRVHVRVVGHTDEFSWLVGRSGERYNLRRNGSTCLIGIEDYIAEPHRFEVIDEPYGDEPYKGLDMQCDLRIDWEGPGRRRRFTCIRCGISTGIVSNGVRPLVRCNRSGAGDKLSGFLKRWFDECDRCSRRRDWLNRLDRYVYRMIWGPKRANYLEKSICPLSTPFTGWSRRIGFSRFTRWIWNAGRPVSADAGQGERGERSPLSANPVGVR